MVGASADELLAQGFKAVGKDFPVFYIPHQEEYALARQERKTAPGYAGFSFNTHDTVRLEEDLLRRDLTINAMAQDDKGAIIDPYGGQQDLQARLLRHVSGGLWRRPRAYFTHRPFQRALSPFGLHHSTRNTRLNARNGSRPRSGSPGT